MSILDDSTDLAETGFENLISLYKGLCKSNLNGVRNVAFRKRYYDGVDNSEWRTFERFDGEPRDL